MYHKSQPVQSIENLRDRVDRLFREPLRNVNCQKQLSLDLIVTSSHDSSISYPRQSIGAFLDFISAAIPNGDVYLFGGVLRDLALLGRRGFNSDIDLVVEGDWSHFVSYLQFLKADKNKFGGYRLVVGGWPIDIWNASETWAIKQGFVSYKGIASLTDTTVLNWDAILMNWRTRSFVFRNTYLEDVSSRMLDIVLEKNPNPLGMAVRVFRHLSLKDARKITASAARYLATCANTYSFEEIRTAEFESYGNTVIQEIMHRFFESIDPSKDISIQHQYSIASNLIKRELELSY